MAVIKKSLAEIEAMKEAGRISAKVLRMAGKHVEPGISTLELDNIVEKTVAIMEDGPMVLTTEPMFRRPM